MWKYFTECIEHLCVSRDDAGKRLHRWGNTIEEQVLMEQARLSGLGLEEIPEVWLANHTALLYWMGRGSWHEEGGRMTVIRPSGVRRIDDCTWYVTAMARDGVSLVSICSQQAFWEVICGCKYSSIYLDVT